MNPPQAAAVTPIAAAGSPAVAKTPAYRRILLKLSGEALMGDDPYGINRETMTASSPRSPRSRGWASKSPSSSAAATSFAASPPERPAWTAPPPTTWGCSRR